ncbi:MAG: GNAT family N-acetyltransferase [Pseudomonadota bacterium]
MASIHVRAATPDDIDFILAMIRGLAEYEKALHEVEATAAQLHDILFCQHPRVEAAIAVADGEAVGIAVYFFNFSTWTGKLGLFLEDLYVPPEHRGRRAGIALLKHLAQLALDRDCGRFEWNVLDWNQPAIDLYESIGAEPMSEWIGYRLSGDALRHFAER